MTTPLEQATHHHEYTRLQTPEQYAPDDYEHTVDGYVGLLGELQETQRALSQDFRATIAGDRKKLHELARPGVETIYESRTAYLKENGLAKEEPLPIEAMSERFLMGLAEPAWKNFMPKNPTDKGDVAAWEAFKAQHDESLSDNLEVLYELHSKIDVLHDDKDLQVAFHEHRGERIVVVAAATKWRKQEQRKTQLSEDIAAIRERASYSGRSLTTRERTKIEALTQSLIHMQDSNLDPSLPKRAFLDELDRLDRRDAKKELESGLLMTDQMKDVIAEALPALLRGEPSLLVGETGGAKTALAEHIAHKYFDTEPELISGHGDVNTYQIMGKQELREENGATVSSFSPGPLVRAMESGRPVILDEVNAMPPELLKRLNKIMQLRPGDTFNIQEDSGRRVTIKPGFCIIGTANEKSKRYKGVEDFSVEFQNRFGANIYRLRYPDHAASHADEPIENDRLATAAITNAKGDFPPDIDPKDFDNFVHACFVSQQIFTGNHGEGFRELVSSERIVDNKPGLEETVLAPRTMVGILKKVAGSQGEVSIKQACARFLDGVKNAQDKQVLERLLAGHDLLEATA